MAVKTTKIRSWADVKAAAAARDAAKYTPKKTVTSSPASQQTVVEPTSTPSRSSAYGPSLNSPGTTLIDAASNLAAPTLSKNSQYTDYQYQIGSDLGKSIADNLPIGATYNNPNDGSVWRKNNDGSISVDYNGYTTQNAYQMSDLGMLGTQQMAAGLDPMLVLSTANARQNKAATTPGLEQYASDALYNQMMQYVTRGQQQGYIDDWTEENPQPTAPEQDPRINRLYNEILNRDDFSYDVTSDPLYQQYAKMYQREGDRAMRETMAEAAAGAGGMNTYAITAAQQANNYYNSQLNDKIPELYQLAYEMYLNDLELKVQDLGLLQSMDATQYNRYRDTMSDWYKDKGFAYDMYRDAVEQGNFERNFAYNSMINERNFNSNEYWANKNYEFKDYWANKDYEFNDYWANKDYEFKDYWANKDYEQTEIDNAQERVEWAISNAEMPSAEDIEKSGYPEEAIKAAVERAKEALKTNVPVVTSKVFRADVTLPDSPKVDKGDDKKGPSGASGGGTGNSASGGGSSSGGTGNSASDGDSRSGGVHYDEPAGPPKYDPSDYEDYEVVGSNDLPGDNFMSRVFVYGYGSVSPDKLYDMMQKDEITEIYDHVNKTITYKWKGRG